MQTFALLSPIYINRCITRIPLIKLAEMNQSSPIKLAKSLEIRPEKCIFAAIIRPEKCNNALIIRPEKCDLNEENT